MRKTSLILLLITNLGWLALLVYRSSSPSGPGVSPESPHAPAPGEQRAETPPAKQPPPAFQWSQIESSDYRSYISNLARIGCPKQTIHDIVAADVHGLYAPRLVVLRDREVRSGQPLETARQKLLEEERGVVAALLGIHSPEKQDPPQLAASAPPVLESEPQEPEPEVAVPLVMAEIDTSSLDLTPTQEAVIASLRQRFVEQIGGPDQDPGDPDYLARWQKAQTDIDQRLRAMIGIKTYDLYQRQTARQQANNGYQP